MVFYLFFEQFDQVVHMQIKKKIIRFYADRNANTTSIKKKTLTFYRLIKRWEKVGILYPNKSTQTHNIEYHRKAQIMKKKYREKYNSDVGTNSLGYIITCSFQMGGG